MKGELLGKGGFARVYRLTDKLSGLQYAAKVIRKVDLVKPRAKKKLWNEIKIHKSLHHNNIVKFKHQFEDKDNVYMLIDLCNNKTMSEMIKRRKRLTEFEVRCLTR